MLPSSGSAQQPFILIKTKLSVPQPCSCAVSRPRVLGLLSEGSARALTLVCAPPGYGKTTMLVEWIGGLPAEGQGRRPAICWLSLDEGDNEPALFLNYLAAAFENRFPTLGGEIRALLRTTPLPPFQAVLGMLINALDNLPGEVCLVLDDYQFISNPAIHQGLAFFLDHLPANVHLFLLTRSDPPLMLARLRARGQLVEIRASDLQFSLDETGILLSHATAAKLSQEDVSHLVERTEGWAAGLQMAALALKNQKDPSLFVRNFTGSHRYILDYLAEEVLRQQPEAVQDFLMRTSVLENLNGDLCDAVIGGATGKADNSSQAMLEYLERANLFLVSLDAERTWYRYHHLFADLLLARLEKQSPQEVSGLHLRASKWYEQNGRLPEAINHALAARDYDPACRLIEPLVEQYVAQNGMGLLLKWIDQLPPEIALSRPWLCIARAWSCLFTNSVEKIEPFLQAAEQNMRLEGRPDLRSGRLGHIACLRAFIADVQGDVPRTIEMARLALESLHPEDAANRTFAKYMLGRGSYIRGDLSQAAEILTENARDCMRAGLTNIIAPTLSQLSIIYRIQGRLRASVALLRAGKEYIEKNDPRRVTVAGVAYVGQAYVMLEWNELDAAEKLGRRALELTESWVNPSATCGCCVLLARVYQAQDKLPAAEEMLRRAEESIHGRGPLAGVNPDLDAARVGFWLAAGQVTRASQWAQSQSQNSAPGAAFSIVKEQEEITLARVLIAEGKFEAALRSLESLAGMAEPAGRFGRLVVMRGLQALAFQGCSDRTRALEALEKSLALAEPEAYLRAFLDEGQPMHALLLVYSQAQPAAHQPYVQGLLGAFTVAGKIPLPQAQHPAQIEPLTRREIDVLQLMAEGFSNHKIAEKLFLAEGTVKFYVHTVLEKLGVHNRTQAIVEAKKQKII